MVIMYRNEPKYIVCHCSDVSYQKYPNQFYMINRYHKEREFPRSSLDWYGGYHILVSGGKEYRYRQDWEVGAHCNNKVNGISMNFQSLGICWAGDGDIEFPTPQDTELIKKRIKKWQDKYYIPNDQTFISPHRRWNPNKTCYGSLLSDDWAFLLNNPIEKELEQKYKHEKIAQMQKQLDCIRQLLLRIKIFLKQGRNYKFK